jgi:hypothetical protein
MNNSEKNNEAAEREKLWEEVKRNAAEIRRRLLALVEHPDVPGFFKSSSVVKEVIE